MKNLQGRTCSTYWQYATRKMEVILGIQVLKINHLLQQILEGGKKSSRIPQMSKKRRDRIHSSMAVQIHVMPRTIGNNNNPLATRFRLKIEATVCHTVRVNAVRLDRERTTTVCVYTTHTK